MKNFLKVLQNLHLVLNDSQPTRFLNLLQLTQFLQNDTPHKFNKPLFILTPKLTKAFLHPTLIPILSTTLFPTFTQSVFLTETDHENNSLTIINGTSSLEIISATQIAKNFNQKISFTLFMAYTFNFKRSSKKPLIFLTSKIFTY